jgi:hypothetical protein
MSQSLNICSDLNFTCDNCQKSFQNETAYSPATNLDELDYQPTYCINCIEIIKEKPRKKTKSK